MAGSEPTRLTLSGSGGVRIAADAWGDPDAPGVLFAHGGGQTRHAWGNAAATLARRGWYAVSIDMRGHGDSDWAPDGDYRFDTFARDVATIAETAFDRPPVMVGASLGGMAGLLAQDERGGKLFAALVLVDITPRLRREGVNRIVEFMKAHMKEGFASPEEAAEAVARYLPHRKRDGGDAEGLRKNLRRDDDGRYRWHWDPRFIEGADRDPQGSVEERMEAAAGRLDIPVLLVRGRMSDVVTEEEARAFLKVAPHAEYADVSGASHMVAGDRNDAFIEAVVGFLAKLSEAA